MRKTDKKIEKSIVSALKEACEDALKVYDGFQWLTHVVNYQKFPESLTIVCVFDGQESLSNVLNQDQGHAFKASINTKLMGENIKIKNIEKRIIFDTEEACEAQHGGSWSKRLDGLQHARHA